MGQLQEPLQIGARDFGGHTASFACQEQCHQIKHGDLRGETLGGGHGEFGTGSGNQSGAGFTRYGRIGDIGDGDGPYSTSERFALRGNGIGSFPGLGYDHHDGGDCCMSGAIAILAGIFNVDGNPREIFDHDLAGQSSVAT